MFKVIICSVTMYFHVLNYTQKYAIINIGVRINETSMQEEQFLELYAQGEDDFCEHLKEKYDDSHVVTGMNEYKYANGKISLIKKKAKTIKNYEEKYNCN